MIQITLRTLLITTSVLFASCSSSLPEEAANASNNTSDNVSKPLSNVNELDNTDESAESSVDGLWDLSVEGDEVYQLWTDNNFFTIFDYQADQEGTGENCYIEEEVLYTREGSEFNVADETLIITRDANILTIDGEPFPLINFITIIDLDICL